MIGNEVLLLNYRKLKINFKDENKKKVIWKGVSMLIGVNYCYNGVFMVENGLNVK